MRPKWLPMIALLSLAALPLNAQNACPCVPTTHVWVAKTCPSWDCANTELLLANGDRQVFAVPVGVDDERWIVVRRFVAGAAAEDPNDPFHLDAFEHMDDAVTKYAGFTSDYKPMLTTAPDGRVLVIALRQPDPPKRRTASH
jgi:hypothetical protein